MFDWIPLERVGPFRFNEAVEPLVESGMLLKQEGDVDGIGWETYSPPNSSLEICVEMKSGLIVCVRCDEQCYLEGVNLIGLGLEELQLLLNEEPEPNPESYYIGDDLQDVYEFADSDAQVWVSRGKIVGIYCSADAEFLLS